MTFKNKNINLICSCFTMVVVESISPSTEIRHLPAKVVQELCRLLDFVDKWKQLAEKIPTSSKDTTPLYSQQHVSAMEKCTQGPTLTLINDWGTHGRNRPTLELLIKLLLDSNLNFVANYLAVDVLKGASISGDFLSTTAEVDKLYSPVHANGESSENLDAFKSTDLDYVDLSAIRIDVSKRVHVVSHEYLKEITNGFNEEQLNNGGRKIGKGAFSEVYLGIDDTKKYAVKRLKIEFHEAFKREVNLLSTYQHKNVITLFFASVSESYLCLVYEYMSNGALQDRLSLVDNSSSIPWRQRIQIAIDISEALVYIHKQEYVHRDVKSANILLDGQWVAKLGDFGIAHIGPDLNLETILTGNVIGTHVYMPHEAMYGIISTKLDTYSFGVVLLELLTGLLPLNKETNDSLIDVVTGNCTDDKSIQPMLDQSAGEWNVRIADEVFQIATQCLSSYRGNRPYMTEVLTLFQNLVWE